MYNLHLLVFSTYIISTNISYYITSVITYEKGYTYKNIKKYILSLIEERKAEILKNRQQQSEKVGKIN